MAAGSPSRDWLSSAAGIGALGGARASERVGTPPKPAGFGAAAGADVELPGVLGAADAAAGRSTAVVAQHATTAAASEERGMRRRTGKSFWSGGEWELTQHQTEHGGVLRRAS
ncbi:hypothetical protein GCM10023235_13910 [Kitasatospora terrestris]|uniref:Uncharacterized protein n=1 Tax=Kitasatospora terrestris TaxID=258051 RepID=A0ABP9DDW5_9ACTN